MHLLILTITDVRITLEWSPLLYAFNAGFWPVLTWGLWIWLKRRFNESD